MDTYFFFLFSYSLSLSLSLLQSHAVELAPPPRGGALAPAGRLRRLEVLCSSRGGAEHRSGALRRSGFVFPHGSRTAPPTAAGGTRGVPARQRGGTGSGAAAISEAEGWNGGGGVSEDRGQGSKWKRTWKIHSLHPCASFGP